MPSTRGVRAVLLQDQPIPAKLGGTDLWPVLPWSTLHLGWALFFIRPIKVKPQRPPGLVYKRRYAHTCGILKARALILSTPMGAHGCECFHSRKSSHLAAGLLHLAHALAPSRGICVPNIEPSQGICLPNFACAQGASAPTAACFSGLLQFPSSEPLENSHRLTGKSQCSDLEKRTAGLQPCHAQTSGF